MIPRTWMVVSALALSIVSCRTMEPANKASQINKGDDGLRGKESTESMTHADLAAAIKSHLLSAFPNIQVKVEPWDEDASRIAVYFTDEAFSGLYPRQRLHYLIHSLPDDFVQEHLSQSVWFELAPGESLEDLQVYDEPDDELIESIAPDVMDTLEKSGFFTTLDDVMAPEDGTLEGEPCHGDFRITKRILERIFAAFQLNEVVDMGADAWVADTCHVLMFKGAYCDCEVLFNVYEGSRLGRRVWRKHSEVMGESKE